MIINVLPHMFWLWVQNEIVKSLCSLPNFRLEFVGLVLLGGTHRGWVVKVNVDSSFMYSYADSKSGIVIRDFQGKVLCFAVCQNEGMLSPLQAELNAILEGLILEEAQGYGSIVIESDSLVAIYEIHKRNSQCLWFSILVNIFSLENSFSNSICS
ncbi:hypothetical protein PTKIN_Ptkin06aG0133800 [Pterospermum kingtungense]